MKDEIKEILDELKECNDYDISPVLLQSNEVIILLDYITNLQEENERLRKNQRYYKNGVFSLEYDKETMSDIIDDYKSRIEKAIEYIKEHIRPDAEYPYYMEILVDDRNELLNILQGE